MKRTQPCVLHRLAESPGLTVDHCPKCGVLHVGLGPVSVRVEADGLDGLLTVLGAARSELRRAEGSWALTAGAPARA